VHQLLSSSRTRFGHDGACPKTLNRPDDAEAIADAHVVAALDVAERTSNP